MLTQGPQAPGGVLAPVQAPARRGDECHGHQGQLTAQRARLTGGAGSLAPAVAGYERLAVDRDLANRAYASALQSLETARLDAQKQHVYLVRVVEPNLPVKSTYPKRAVTVLGVFGALLLAYGIGWLIVVGVREHAA